MSKLVSDIGADAEKASTFIGTHGKPADWLSGPIIDTLIAPFNEAAAAFQQRTGDIGTQTTSTAAELNKAAWMYHNQDQKNYLELNKQTLQIPLTADAPYGSDTEVTGATAPYVDAVSYSKPNEFKLEEPQANKEELADLIKEVFPVLGNVNDAIKDITRTAGNEVDPLGKALEPIPGNWTEVRRIGEAYKAAGNGMEACGKNLEAGQKRVDPFWNGKAGVAFNDWADRQIAAMKWEGPVGRIISDAMTVVSDEIKSAIRTILDKLWELLESYVDFGSIKGVIKTIAKTISSSIPAIGIARVVELGVKLARIVNTAINLVQTIRDLVEKVKTLLEFIKDPLGKLKDKGQQKLEETIAPFTDKMSDAAHKAAIASDLAQIAQINSTLNRPKESFEVGAGTDPWADAK
ncbi:hypothetical protein [Nocardia huaxiensis]|uniref:hypothetical protein n=1 Tax=Nocardia huaxiensis TaxID=2755382 RepID=UPI001E3B6D9B|nr:hypothetical protein [Nocardia huaxiensis]UFS95471.1 hypothetical protein LPY97_33145 [Nocardia huaxiensis]